MPKVTTEEGFDMPTDEEIAVALEEQIMRLRQVLIFDATELSDDEKTQWQYYYTKQRPDEEWTFDWVENRFLASPWALGENFLPFKFYDNLFISKYFNGKLSMLTTKSFSDAAKQKYLKEHPLEEGQFVLLVPLNEKGRYALRNVDFDRLVLHKAKAITSEEADELLQGLDEKARTLLEKAGKTQDVREAQELSQNAQELFSEIQGAPKVT